MTALSPFRSGRLALATAVAVVCAAAGPVAVAHAAAGGDAHEAVAAGRSAAKTPPADFNGDGHADLAVGSPDGTAGGKANAGYVSVVYGAPGGVHPATHYLFSQDSPGIPGASEAGDAFGDAVLPVDLNGDGYTDLVVSAPGEDIGTGTAGVDAGMLTVLWGSPSGLGNATAIDTGSTKNARVGGFLQAGAFTGGTKQELVTNVGESLRTLSGIGTDGKVASVSDVSLSSVVGTPVTLHSDAAGDINGDGTTDLVVLATDQDNGSYYTVLLLGGANGFTAAATPKGPDGQDLQGESVAVGDVNGDGYGDIVLGQTDIQDGSIGGAVAVAYGGPNGQSTTVPPVWINQDTAGVPGADESQDGMGSSVAVGDVNGDGYADVVAGVPGEDFDNLTDAGSFLLLLGSAKGLTGTGSEVFSQNSDGVPGVSESGDKFATTVGVLPATASDPAQVVAGDPEENAGNGAVWVLHGTSTGLTGANTANWGAATVGADAVKARYGEALSTTPYDVDVLDYYL